MNHEKTTDKNLIKFEIVREKIVEFPLDPISTFFIKLVNYLLGFLQKLFICNLKLKLE